jgi:hypothetical protein
LKRLPWITLPAAMRQVKICATIEDDLIPVVYRLMEKKTMKGGLQGILMALRPDSSIGIVGYVLYTIIILVVLSLALQKQSTLQLTMMMSAVILCAIIDKINTSGQLFSNRDFAAYMIRIVMFVFPLVFAGMTRTPRSRGPAIVAGVIAMIYMFARWFGEMRG